MNDRLSCARHTVNSESMGDKMKIKKLLVYVLTAVLLVTGFTGCSILQPQFADYDVSGYISALLKSSYLGDHDDYMVFAKTTVQNSEENNTATISNAAINFCNAFDIYPSDEQLAAFEAIMASAFKLVKYKVKDEQKIDTGYYIEVEIEPLLMFQELNGSIEQARADSKKHLLEGQSAITESSGDEESDTGETDSDYYDEYEGSEAESSLPEEGTNTEPLDENTAFVNEVVRLCQQALSQPSQSYGSSIVIPLDIRQTDAGELQMDLMQIEKIDDTVISFGS